MAPSRLGQRQRMPGVAPRVGQPRASARLGQPTGLAGTRPARQKGPCSPQGGGRRVHRAAAGAAGSHAAARHRPWPGSTVSTPPGLALSLRARWVRHLAAGAAQVFVEEERTQAHLRTKPHLVGVRVGVRVGERPHPIQSGLGSGSGSGHRPHREVAAPVDAALRRDLEARRVRPHALDDADDLGARLHDDLAAAMGTADQVLRVRLLVEVHLVAVTPQPEPQPGCVEAHHEEIAQAVRLVARVQEDRVRAPPAGLLRAEGVEPREHRVGRARRCRRACVVRAWTLRATARSMRIRLPSVSKHRLHERADAGWVIRDR
eukprot:scaffold31471_cov49-Phaeocystis_antarctica.AAC.2